VRLHHNTNLRFLHLNVCRMLESNTGLAPLLSGVISSRIEEISLGIIQFSSPNGNTVAMEWGDVDVILAGRQFSNLKSVSVRHTMIRELRYYDTPYSLEWFFDQLPLCHKWDILRLCEARTYAPFI
jgi:hypothetical protein